MFSQLFCLIFLLLLVQLYVARKLFVFLYKYIVCCIPSFFIFVCLLALSALSLLWKCSLYVQWNEKHFYMPLISCIFKTIFFLFIFTSGKNASFSPKIMHAILFYCCMNSFLFYSYFFFLVFFFGFVVVVQIII